MILIHFLVLINLYGVELEIYLHNPHSVSWLFNSYIDKSHSSFLIQIPSGINFILPESQSAWHLFPSESNINLFDEPHSLMQ